MLNYFKMICNLKVINMNIKTKIHIRMIQMKSNIIIKVMIKMKMMMIQKELVKDIVSEELK